MILTEIEKEIIEAKSPDYINNFINKLEDNKILTDKEVRYLAALAAHRLIELTTGG